MFLRLDYVLDYCELQQSISIDKRMHGQPSWCEQAAYFVSILRVRKCKFKLTQLLI